MQSHYNSLHAPKATGLKSILCNFSDNWCCLPLLMVFAVFPFICTTTISLFGSRLLIHLVAGCESLLFFTVHACFPVVHSPYSFTTTSLFFTLSFQTTSALKRTVAPSFRPGASCKSTFQKAIRQVGILLAMHTPARNTPHTHTEIL